MANKNLGWINDIKGSVILLVILYHSILNFKVMYGDVLTSPSVVYELWLYFNQKLAPLRMPIFFFVSGFLALSYINRTSLKDICKGKALNFLTIYLIWNVIVWAFISLIHFIYGDSLSSTNSVYSNNLLEFLESTVISRSSIWYLFALALYYFICKPLIKYPIFLVFFALILNVLLNQYLNFDWNFESIGRNLLYFSIGLTFGKNITNIMIENKTYALLATSFFVILSLILKGEWRVFTDLSFCFFFLSIFIVFEKLISKLGFRSLGKKTLMIYVSHRIFVEILMVVTLLIILRTNSNLILELVFFLYPILTCVFSVLFAYNFEKYQDSLIYKLLLSPIETIKKRNTSSNI